MIIVVYHIHRYTYSITKLERVHKISVFTELLPLTMASSTKIEVASFSHPISF